MNRRFFITSGTIGAFALFVAVGTVDVQAQRGAGIGHASAPTHAGQGRPATAGRPDNAGRPAGATGKPTTTSGKPESAGRPTIADRLSRDHGLATQLRKLFPMGTDLVALSDGFDNLGQFVAAAHVANNNPNFTFEELAAKMHDGEGMSLGAAIHALDPKADAETEVETAQTQTAADLKAADKKK
jgi:hypothetical protein